MPNLSPTMEKVNTHHQLIG